MTFTTLETNKISNPSHLYHVYAAFLLLLFILQSDSIAPFMLLLLLLGNIQIAPDVRPGKRLDHVSELPRLQPVEMTHGAFFAHRPRQLTRIEGHAVGGGSGVHAHPVGMAPAGGAAVEGDALVSAGDGDGGGRVEGSGAAVEWRAALG
jgi:hypothetical protein